MTRRAKKHIVPGEGGEGDHRNKYPKGKGRTRSDVEGEQNKQDRRAHKEQ